MSGAQTLAQIHEMTAAAQRFAQAVELEARLEDERPAAKAAAIGRIMESGVNPLNGKPHSASSAEAVVEMDADYKSYRATQRKAVTDKIMAKALLDAKKLEARLALELLVVTGGTD